jgi:ribosomal protein S18 acetylase RimI-like enzyme
MGAKKPDEGFDIRRARADDALAIGAVFDAAVREGWSYLGPIAREPMFADEDWHRLVADHAAPRSLLVAVSAGGGIVGYCAVHPEDCEMYLLFVDPAWGGRGVGRALLGSGHEALRGAGCDHALLYTEERNERALSFYAAAGYRPDGSAREPEFRGLRLRELRLVASLREG